MATYDVQYGYTHSLKNQFYLHHHNTLHEHWAPLWGKEWRKQGTCFTSGTLCLWQQRVWTIWELRNAESISRELKHPWQRGVSPQGQKSAVSTHRTRKCLGPWCILIARAPCTFKHFLHITIISCLICPIFPEEAGKPAIPDSLH